MGALIFCESYGQIETILCLAERNPRETSLIFTANRDLYKFFQIVNKGRFNSLLNLIYIEPFMPRRAALAGLRKARYIIPDLKNERRYLENIGNNYFSGFAQNEVYFFSRGFNGYLYAFLRMLSIKNRLIYVSHAPPNTPPMKHGFPRNLSEVAKMIINKSVFGWGITLGQLPTTSERFPFIPDSFMKTRVGKVLNWSDRVSMLKDFSYESFFIKMPGNYSVLYLDDGLAESDFFETDIFQKQLKNIFTILTKHFPANRIARKYHPNYPGKKTLIDVGDVLPDYIPAEMFYTDNIKIYLSMFSTSLGNVKKGLAISFLELVPFKNEAIKAHARKTLQSISHSQIQFPQTLDELQKLVACAAEGSGMKP